MTANKHHGPANQKPNRFRRPLTDRTCQAGQCGNYVLEGRAICTQCFHMGRKPVPGTFKKLEPQQQLQPQQHVNARAPMPKPMGAGVGFGPSSNHVVPSGLGQYQPMYGMPAQAGYGQVFSGLGTGSHMGNVFGAPSMPAYTAVNNGFMSRADGMSASGAGGIGGFMGGNGGHMGESGGHMGGIGGNMGVCGGHMGGNETHAGGNADISDGIGSHMGGVQSRMMSAAPTAPRKMREADTGAAVQSGAKPSPTVSAPAVDHMSFAPQSATAATTTSPSANDDHHVKESQQPVIAGQAHEVSKENSKIASDGGKDQINSSETTELDAVKVEQPKSAQQAHEVSKEHSNTASESGKTEQQVSEKAPKVLEDNNGVRQGFRGTSVYSGITKPGDWPSLLSKGNSAGASIDGALRPSELDTVKDSIARNEDFVELSTGHAEKVDVQMTDHEGSEIVVPESEMEDVESQLAALPAGMMADAYGEEEDEGDESVGTERPPQYVKAEAAGQSDLRTCPERWEPVAQRKHELKLKAIEAQEAARARRHELKMLDKQHQQKMELKRMEMQMGAASNGDYGKKRHLPTSQEPETARPMKMPRQTAASSFEEQVQTVPCMACAGCGMNGAWTHNFIDCKYRSGEWGVGFFSAWMSENWSDEEEKKLQALLASRGAGAH